MLKKSALVLLCVLVITTNSNGCMEPNDLIPTDEPAGPDSPAPDALTPPVATDAPAANPQLEVLPVMVSKADLLQANEGESPAIEAWKQFRGPNCEGICLETGLMQSVPEGGPELLWQATGLGTGYSSISIADSHIYTMGDIDVEGEKKQCVISLDMRGNHVWATPIGPRHNDGPRCTPTCDNGLLYVLGTDGDLACLTAASGEIVWRKNLQRNFGGEMMSVWKFSESPIVDGDKLLCTPGVADAGIVALNKTSGDEIWRCTLPELGPAGKDGAGYATIVPAEIDGVRQYITMIGRGLIAADAETGRFLWEYNHVANGTANITSPVVRGNQIFVTSSYRTGSALIEVHRDGDTFEVNELYFIGPKVFENHHGGVVVVGEHVYGGDGQNKGAPVCLDLKTGVPKWKVEPIGKRSAAMIYADGQLFVRYEDGVVAMVEATPDEFKLNGVFTQAFKDGPSWAHPVIHDGKLYLREKDVLMCYDISLK